tara:strand:- start:980 stop:1297 length:318 start_codon:yes stop_codon:yes gene_type:complete
MNNRKYLGEFDVNINNTPFKNYTENDWACHFLFHNGLYDGQLQKNWTIDQALQILKGTKVIVKEARWSDGYSKYKITLDEPSDEYKKFLAEQDEEYFDEDELIAP